MLVKGLLVYPLLIPTKVGNMKTINIPKDDPTKLTILETSDWVEAISPIQKQNPKDIKKLFLAVYYNLKNLNIIGFIGPILSPPKMTKLKTRINLPKVINLSDSPIYCLKIIKSIFGSLNLPKVTQPEIPVKSITQKIIVKALPKTILNRFLVGLSNEFETIKKLPIQL